VPVYFGQQASFGSRTPTRAIPTQTATINPVPTPVTPPAKRRSIGAIVGGTIGGTAALILPIGVAFFCLRKRKRNHHVHGDSIQAPAHTKASNLGSPTADYGSEATFVAVGGHEPGSPVYSPAHSHTHSSSYPAPTKQQVTAPMYHPAHAPSPMEYYPPPDADRPNLFHLGSFEMPTVRSP
jgi:hypothetical protein